MGGYSLPKATEEQVAVSYKQETSHSPLYVCEKTLCSPARNGLPLTLSSVNSHVTFPSEKRSVHGVHRHSRAGFQNGDTWDLPLRPKLSYSSVYMLDGKVPLSPKDYCRFECKSRNLDKSRSISSISSKRVLTRPERVVRSRKLAQQNITEVTKKDLSLLRHDLPKTPLSWSSEDDILLRSLKEIRKLGWKEIAAYFPSRTAHACQFRWRRLVSGTLKGQRDGRIHLSKTSISPFGTPEYSNIGHPPAMIHNSTPLAADFKDSHPIEISTQKDSTESTSDGLPGSKLPFANLIRLATVHDEQPAICKVTPTNLELEVHQNTILHNSRRDLPFCSKKTVQPKPLNGTNQDLHKIDIKQSEDPAGFSNMSHSGCTSLKSSLPALPNHEPWMPEEDSLLLNRRLSFDEVSILLQYRSEEEIWTRMGALRAYVGRATEQTILSS